MPDLVALRVQVDTIGSESAMEITVCISEGWLEVEVVDVFLFRESSNIVVQPTHTIVGNSGEASGQNGVNKNLGARMFFAESLHDLL